MWMMMTFAAEENEKMSRLFCVLGMFLLIIQTLCIIYNIPINYTAMTNVVIFMSAVAILDKMENMK